MKKTFLLLTVILLPAILLSCKKKDPVSEKEKALHASSLSVHQYARDSKASLEKSIHDFVLSMDEDEKIGQLFVVNLVGNKNFTPVEYDAKGNPRIAGGYLFFSYNLSDSIQEVKDFTDNIKDWCLSRNFIPPYLTIDQEGGWVQRLKNLSPKLPSAEKVAQENSIEEALALYTEQAAFMKKMGFHMNLAPVVEICTDKNADFLMERSFGNAEQTELYSRTAVFAYENNGISTVIKHFPGNTNTDPHTGLPEITLSMEELKESLEPFYSVLAWNPDAVLMSHARTTCLDGDVPACLSKKWVTDTLRKEHNYQGLIFSDDIYMGALAQNGYPPEKAVIMALEAGIDIIMISEKRFGKLADVISEQCKNSRTFEEEINSKVERILMWKYKKGIWQAGR